VKSTLVVTLMVVVVGSTAVVDARNLNLNIKPKSPVKATTLSLLGTFVPTVLGVSLIRSEGGVKTGLALFLVGTTLGPSRGHDYAGNRRQAMSGFLIRTGFWLGGLFVAAVAPNVGWGPSGTEIGAIFAAAGLVTVSALYDIATAARSAREYNRKNGFGDLCLSPTFDLSKKQAGVRLSMQF